MTHEFKMLSQAASFGAPAASTNETIAIQKELVKNGFIKLEGWRQNSMTMRYRITDAGKERLAGLRVVVQ